MTERLQHAFLEAAKLSPAEQDLLAARLLAELAGDDDFDRAISQSSAKLTKLANDAITEHQAGESQVLDPDQL